MPFNAPFLTRDNIIDSHKRLIFIIPVPGQDRGRLCSGMRNKLQLEADIERD
jgi:hypothetical protein